MIRLLSKPSRGKRRLAYLLLLINTIVWGAALIFVKPAFETTTPFRFLLYRYVLAIFLTLPVLGYYLSRFKLPFKKLLTIIVLELFGTTLTLSILYLGLARTSAIEASMITTTSPIFVILAGIFLLKEKQHLHETIGTTIAFLAATGLVLLPLLHSGSQLSFSVLGNILVLGQNITSAIFYVIAKKLYLGIPKLLITSISFYVGAVSFFILSLAESNFSMSSLVGSVGLDLQNNSVLFASAYMALFGSIIGLTAYMKGQELIEASEASIFWYLQPLVYVPLALFLLNEKVSFAQIVLLGLILLGVIIAEKRFKFKRSLH